MELTCDPPECWLAGNYTHCDVECQVAGIWGNCVPVISNPDIAGPGVIVAYFASAMLAIVVLIMAYLTDSLPAWYCNELDHFCVYNSSGSLRFAKWAAKINREKRVEAFERFMIALSDQQLITGIVLLIASIALHRSLSYYDYSIVTSLAWFSSTVHLVTLVMLRDYLMRQTFLRNIRVGCMLLTLVLLVFSLIVTETMAGEYPGTPVSCIFSNSNRDRIEAPYFIIVIIVLMFAASIAASGRRSKNIGQGGQTGLLLLKYLNLPFVPPRVRKALLSPQGFSNLVSLAESEIRLRFDYFTTLYLAGTSFLWNVGAIVFCGAFGITFFISKYSPRLGFMITWSSVTRGSLDIGFGQLLPMLFLCLPFLAAFEAVSENTAYESPDGEGGRITLDTNNDVGVELAFSQNLTKLKSYFYKELASMSVKRDAGTLPSREVARLLLIYVPIAEVRMTSCVRTVTSSIVNLFIFSYLTFVFASGALGLVWSNAPAVQAFCALGLSVFYLFEFFPITLHVLIALHKNKSRDLVLEVMEADLSFSTWKFEDSNSREPSTDEVTAPNLSTGNVEPLQRQGTASAIV